jgi:hypothetical protein
MAGSSWNWYSVSPIVSRDDECLLKGLPTLDSGRYFRMYRFILVPLPGGLHIIVLARLSLASYRNPNTTIERRVLRVLQSVFLRVNKAGCSLLGLVEKSVIEVRLASDRNQDE